MTAPDPARVRKLVAELRRINARATSPTKWERLAYRWRNALPDLLAAASAWAAAQEPPEPGTSPGATTAAYTTMHREWREAQERIAELEAAPDPARVRKLVAELPPLTVEHRPGGELTGIDAEIAELDDAEPYALTVTCIPEIGAEITWDDRRPPALDPRDALNALVLAAAELPNAQERIAELEAALEEARKPRDRSQTHSEGCWRWRHHHECAIARVEELEAENTRLRAQLDAAQSEPSAVAVGTREPQT